MPDFKLADLLQTTGLGQEEGEDHDISIEERLRAKPQGGTGSVGVRKKDNERVTENYLDSIHKEPCMPWKYFKFYFT